MIDLHSAYSSELCPPLSHVRRSVRMLTCQLLCALTDAVLCYYCDRWHVSCQHVLEADTCDTCVTSQYKQGQPCVTHESLIRLSVTITRMRCQFTCLSWRVREFKVSRWHFHAWYELCVSSFSFLTSWAPVNSGLGLAGLTEQSSPLLSSSRGHEWLRRTGWLM